MRRSKNIKLTLRLMDNLNIKAIILAICLVIFTYFYYAKSSGSFLSLGAVIAFGIVLLVMCIGYFFVIKIFGYFVSSGKIYPHLAFRILWPFVVFSLFSWLIYGLTCIKPFGINSDFINLIKVFAGKHLVFIAICSLAIGLTLSFTRHQSSLPNEIFLRKNLIFLAGTAGIIFFSTWLFYITKKISQPALTIDLASYKSLDEINSSKEYNIARLLGASQNSLLTVPFFLPGRNELIIIVCYKDNNKDKAIESIYRIDKDGEIKEKLSESDVVNSDDDDFFPLICKNGILTDHSSKKMISWIFDGNKTKQPAENFELKLNWKIDTITADAKAVNMIHFYKTAAFHCNNISDLKYNGNKYFEIIKNNKTIKIRVDSVFSHSDNIKNCEEKKLEYYQSSGFNFSLLRLSEKVYYIIKAKK